MSEKTLQETRTEVIAGLLLILVLALFILGDISSPLALTGAGVVLLGSGYYQTRRGWHVSWQTWALGLLLTLGGLGVRVFLVAVLNVNWIAIGLLLVGGYTLYQFMKRDEPSEKKKNTPE